MTTYNYPSGRSVHYVYDSLGRVTQRTIIGGSLSQQWSFTYDGDSTRYASVTEPNGQVTTFSYNADGNLINSTKLAVDIGNGTQNLSTTFTYTSAGLIATMNDAQNITTSFGYNVA